MTMTTPQRRLLDNWEAPASSKGKTNTLTGRLMLPSEARLTPKRRLIANKPHYLPLRPSHTQLPKPPDSAKGPKRTGFLPSANAYRFLITPLIVTPPTAPSRWPSLASHSHGCRNLTFPIDEEPRYLAKTIAVFLMRYCRIHDIWAEMHSLPGSEIRVPANKLVVLIYTAGTNPNEGRDTARFGSSNGSADSCAPYLEHPRPTD
ncbi:uncharacterized protein MEPE_05245 [Melanopsichium pennsylvanicum]|uniref:Uncharacterized protein n=1 Tax=Melanopsichium pennsylvanicum TaxID=63383 RepID=A0AAJ5C744_9BASI|nr:uncharacterized protein MEPE_05245 [Melanopsichium pennsylvanicum]